MSHYFLDDSESACTVGPRCAEFNPCRTTPAWNRLLRSRPSITATKTDSFPDLDGDGKASPGETITYDVNISNTGPDDATDVNFSDTIDANTTLVAAL